jgi:protein ImuB
LVITAATDRGATLSRTWRCAAPLTAAATADRLRWQLDGWLTHRREPGAITRLVLEPVEAVGSGHIQYGLWGSDGQDDQRAGWAFARVQGLLGPESVLSPVPAGGRSTSDRVVLVPWGDERVSPRDANAPWPGSIPAPSPARLADPAPVAILDETGEPVRLTDRGLLTGPPDRLDGHRIDAWAGPLLLDERWWAGGETTARLQLVTDDGAAVLVRSAGDGWRVEGVYD